MPLRLYATFFEQDHAIAYLEQQLARMSGNNENAAVAEEIV
jgi:hypothetical protein